VPSNLLSELYDLANLDYGWMEGTKCRHRSMVDLSPKAWDVYIKSDSCDATCCPTKRCWRTVIMGGERGGGDMYFAIDVTDPVNPKVLWEHSVLQNLAVVYDEGSTQKMTLPFREHIDPNTGLEDVYFNLKTMPMTWSEPVIGRVRFPGPDDDTTGLSYVSFWRYIKNDSGVPVLRRKIFSTGSCTSSGTKYVCSNNKREIAFIGGGFRNYDPSNLGVTPQPDNDTVIKSLTMPYLLALDIETGENLFQVAWPLLVKARRDADKLYDVAMPSTSTSHYIPWSLGDPSVLDVWDNNDGTDDVGRFAEDGFVDRIYVGDLHGFLYRMTFNFKSFLTLSNNPLTWGVDVNFWPAKPLCTPPNDRNCADLRNNFRGCRQPIIYAPAVAVDSRSVSSDTPALRILFGTGKLDDAPSDNLDQAQMSFYNLKDRVKLYSTTSNGLTSLTGLPNVSATGSFAVTPAYTPGDPDTVTSAGSNLSNGFTISGTRFGILHGDGACYSETGGTNQLMWAGMACSEARGDDCCNWVTSANQPDCCQQGSTTASPAPARTCPNCTSSPTSCPQIDGTTGLYTPCWNCIFDFAYPGERIVGKAVIAGGYVFFTTFSPPDPGGCGTGGTGRLYILDYRCRSFPEDFDPLLGTSGLRVVNLMTNESTPRQYGVMVDLGTGMPSRPVLDSKGQSVLLQKSDGTFIRFPAPKFLVSPIQFKGGWDEK
jgi:type IV pilus assembly protein PilY1